MRKGEIQRTWMDKTKMRKFKVSEWEWIKREGEKKKEENCKTFDVMSKKKKNKYESVLEEIQWIEDKVRVKKEEEVERRVKRKRWKKIEICEQQGYLRNLKKKKVQEKGIIECKRSREFGELNAKTIRQEPLR